MLVYEKKVEGERHLFGTVEGTVPSENDVQLTYKDAEGQELELTLADTYLDDGKGGIIRKSDNEAVNVFIGDTQIIGGDIPTPTPQMVSITVTPPTKTSYVEGEALDLAGMVVTGNLSNGETIVITEDYSASPANGATLTTENNKVVVTYFELTDEFAITVEAAPVITPTKIEVTTKPTKLAYTDGEALDLSGMVVTLFGTDGTQEITETLGVNEYVTTPVDGAILTTDPTGEIEVVVSAFDFEDSFTVTVTAAQEPGE